jgi:hypothetical protein
MKPPLCVKDLLPDKIECMKFLFILESPYLNELYYQVPLAGNSGKSITNFIRKHISTEIPMNYPFGSYIKNYNNAILGIMNCATHPLSKKVYENFELLDETNIDKINEFESIRQNPHRFNFNDALNKNISIYKILNQKFEDRLIKYHKKNKNFTIISCGKLSENFIQNISNSSFQILSGHKVIQVPHPSYNQWFKEKNAQKMQVFIDAFKSIVAFPPSLATKQ